MFRRRLCASRTGSAAFQVITAEGERTEEVPSVDQYALQADDFAAAVFGERPPLFSPGDAVSNMKVVDACLLSAEKRERVEIR